MGVAVYPRLDDLLQKKGLSVAELERRIERRFGISIDPKTLYRLTSGEPVQRADLEIAGAVTAILDVGLSDLFDVHAVPVDEQDGESAEDDPTESRRLAELFDRQARGAMSEADQQELDALVSAYGRRLHERRIREIAQQRGIPVEQARREVAAELDQALTWWQTFEANPAHRTAIAAQAGRG
ncbi:MAG: helix-turn-helix domain-containing protein, partial [Dehalococcoidia bacterium]